MRSLIQRTAPINNRTEDRTAGGVTLEAALVMPIFLMFVFFLISVIQTAVISMALHSTLSQTARQAASAWYPISLSLEQARSSELNQQIESWNEKWLQVGETVNQYAHWLPSPMKEWAEQATNKTFSLEQQAAKLAFSQLLKQFVEESVLDTSRISLTSAHLPDQQDRAAAYLTLKAEYVLPFQFPFSGLKLVLRDSVRERVWVGGSPSLSRISEAEEEDFSISFVSLEPNPVRPGRKATLVIHAKPGTTVDLSIVYKSGLSQAKNLGSATADSSGKISWTWHVSGRTTPGQWSWQVSNGSGGVYQQAFEVVSHKGAKEGKE
jgi:hypothetical protein